MAHLFIVDIVGWFGAGLVLVAYGAVSSGKIPAKSHLYQLLNLFGSFLLIINTAYYQAFPSTFVNLIWIAIAVLSLLSIRREARRPV